MSCPECGVDFCIRCTRVLAERLEVASIEISRLRSEANSLANVLLWVGHYLAPSENKRPEVPADGYIIGLARKVAESRGQ